MVFFRDQPPNPRPNPRAVLRAMPQTTGYSATRYDTDDEMVLTVWKDGETWDIRIPKPERERRRS